MRVLLLIILSLMFNSSSWAYLTAGKVAVTATSSSSGVPSTSQDSDITDTKGSSVSVGVPVAVTGNMNITGVYQVNGTPISATSNWNQNGSAINYTAGNVGIGSSSPNGLLTVIGGNVGVGSNAPGQALDVVGTVRATSFTGQSGSGLLGAWTNCSGSSCALTTAYHATTDLFVSGIGSVAGGTGALSVVTDSSATPSTVRCSNSVPAATSIGVSCVVRKGDYYEFTTAGSGTTTISNGYTIPIAS